jgi:pimeloyl-ACP methyl ester carboxylesterase
VTVATLLAGFEERTAEILDTQVRYYVRGRGDALVLVHGLGGAATNWSEMAGLLAERRRVVVPDLPGHGASGTPQAGSDLGWFADAVVSCLEHERLSRVSVVGHSLGGAVALRLAFRRPDIVSALVLAAGAGISSTGLRARAGLRILGTLRPSRFAARYRHEVARSPVLKRACFHLLTGDPRALSPRAVHGFLAGSAAATDTTVAGAALLADDPRPGLHALGCPALVLWGARDWFLPLEDGYEFARRLAAPIRVLPDTGHLLIAERAEECARLVEGFLDRVRDVEKSPGEPEALGERLRERPHADRLGRVVAGRNEMDA